MALAGRGVKGGGREWTIQTATARRMINTRCRVSTNNLQYMLIDPINCGFLAVRYKMMCVELGFELGVWRKNKTILVLGADSYAC